MFTLGLKKIIYWLTLLNVGLISTQSVATGPRVAPSLFTDNTEYIYGMDFPPYISHDEIENGVIADIVNAVLKKENISADIMVLPSKNMVKYYFSEENVLAVIGYNFDFNKANKTKADFIPILSVDEFYIYNSQRFPEGLHWEGNLNIFSGMHYGTYKGNNVSAHKEAGIMVKYGRLKSLLTQLELKKSDSILVSRIQKKDYSKIIDFSKKYLLRSLSKNSIFSPANFLRLPNSLPLPAITNFLPFSLKALTAKSIFLYFDNLEIIK